MKRNKRYVRELLGVFERISRDEKLLGDFLADLLTPREYDDIVLRWQIVKRLHKGVPQREIAKDLGVSVATITRGSRELLDEKGGFKRVLKTL
jgi:TrpR family trp operon transcriptional repressor